MKNIKRQFKRISKEADPDPRFVRALELRIREEISPRHPWALRWKTAAVGLTSAGMMLVGAGSYAYASDTVVPGHTLYPVRETIERAEERLAFRPSWKAGVHLRHLARRLHEQEVIERHASDLPTRHLELYNETMNRTVEALPMLPPPTRERVDRRLIELERMYRERVPVESDRITDEQAAMYRHILDAKRDQIRERYESLSPEEQTRLRELYQLINERR